MKTHYTIPIFIPEKSCPFRCIYCNQFHITQQEQQLSKEEITQTIESYLQTFPAQAVKKIAFFGGTFTGMSISEQNYYLDLVYPYVLSGEVAEIQLSTRPDYITSEILENLRHHGVGTIELGAQSLDETVLRHSGRGHTAAAVERAAILVKSYGFTLGLQMMVGLPHDTKARTCYTAQKIIDLGADNTRLYPTLVVRDTPLERLYRAGIYQPLSLEAAIDWTLAAYELFENAGVTVLRVGLHPSAGLRDGSQLVAGPFHISFKELMLTERWRRRLEVLANNTIGDTIEICVTAEERAAAIGYGASNRKMLARRFKSVRFCVVGECPDFQ